MSGKAAQRAEERKARRTVLYKPPPVEDKDDECEDTYSEPESLHSDTLDDNAQPSKSTKRKRASSPIKTKSKSKKSPKKSSPRKKRKTKGEDEEDDPEEIELEDGQEIVGVVVKAPTTGLGECMSSTSSSLQCLTAQINRRYATTYPFSKVHMTTHAIIVPPGQISQNTLQFLTQLDTPWCNDREWFKLHGAYTFHRDSRSLHFCLEI